MTLVWYSVKMAITCHRFPVLYTIYKAKEKSMIRLYIRGGDGFLK